MEQIVALKKLERSLERIRLCENYITLQDLITELHFAYEVSRLGRDAPEPSDLRTLWDAAYYLLTALNNPRRAASLGEEQVSEGFAIAGLVFELLGKLAEVGNDTNARKECYINAAVCDSLSDYEANSAVLAGKYFDPEKTAESFTPSLIGMEKFGRNLVYATLAREFLWIYRQREAIRGLVMACRRDDFRVNWSRQFLGELDFWCELCLALMELSLFMTNGAGEIQERSFQSLLQAKSIARDWSLPSHHWLASILLKCAQKMCRNSVWEVLRSEGFDDRYIQVLARTPWDPVHELWRSQIAALQKIPIQGLAEPINVLSDAAKRVVVSMPTSAGKTLLAELAIVKELQKGDGRKCVYVAPSRALVSEVESKLHKRLRFVDYRVASVVGSFELSFVEEDYLQEVDVAVLTQEKLDYLVRKRDPFMDEVSLIVFDEVHKIGEGHRGWLLETLIAWLLLKQQFSEVKMMFMSALLPKSSRADIRLWVGNGASAPAIVEEWKPTRQLKAICWFSSPGVNWQSPVRIDEKGYRYYVQESANLTFKYEIGDESRGVSGLFDFLFWVDPGRGWKRVGSEANRYRRTLKLLELQSEAEPFLVYFQEKVDLVRFCKYAVDEGYFHILDDPPLRRLVSYVQARLGNEFPLVAPLACGVAFHHGDLPVDVREEIEQAYRDGLIRVLACTTTLAEGVNLPIKTFILGYHQTWGKHRLSVRDFKNIIGRAGRALLETEGRVILVRHPEFDRGKGNEDSVYFDKLANLDPSELEVENVLLDDAEEVAQELDRLALAIQDEQDLVHVEYHQRLIDELSRLQVLVFTLYEDEIIDLSYESIEAFFKRTLLGIQDKGERVVRSASRFGKRLAAISSEMGKEQLRRFNASGLRYASNAVLAALAESIVHRVKDYDLFEISLEIIISREDLKSILEEVWEAQPKAREYPRKAFEVVRDVDHYGLLLDWVGGMEFSELRDKHFQPLKEPIRTAICQHYIASQLSFRLPWVLGALGIHVKPYGHEWINTWFDILPGLVKYGVDSGEAVYFCSIGVHSRFLARRLGELYREDTGQVGFTSWEPIEDWFLHLTPFDLRERAPDLLELSVRQVMQRINSMRRATDELRKQGQLTCIVAGWKYCHGETFVEEFRRELRQQRRPRVLLNHEPDNEFDEYAVSVHYGRVADETRIGYIPREYNEEVATLLALGERVDARIVSVGQLRRDWRPVTLRLALIR